MLNDAVCFKNIFIVTGYADLRFGLDSLAAIFESKLGRNPLNLTHPLAYGRIICDT